MVDGDAAALEAPPDVPGDAGPLETESRDFLFFLLKILDICDVQVVWTDSRTEDVTFNKYTFRQGW